MIRLLAEVSSAPSDIYDTSLVKVLVVIGLVSAAIEAVRRSLVKPLLEIRDGQRLLRESVFGIPARQGIPAVPGVLEHVRVIEAEVKPNGGGSIKDAVKRIEATGNETAAKVTQIITDRATQTAEWQAWRQDTNEALQAKNALDATNVQAATDDRNSHS